MLFTIPTVALGNCCENGVAWKAALGTGYTITVLGADGGEVIAPESPLTVKANDLRTTSLFILLPRSAFVNGQHDVTIRITAGPSFTTDTPFNLLGPVAASGTTP